MKKALLATAAILALFSCSKEDNDIVPTDGQYVCEAMDTCFSAVLSNGKCIEFTVYIQGEFFGSWSNGNIANSGRYPNYEFVVDNDMYITVKFCSLDHFEALLSGMLRVGHNDDNTLMPTEKTLAMDSMIPVQFYLDSKDLDEDCDGFLDGKQ